MKTLLLLPLLLFSQPDSNYRIAVDVNLILLNATVRNEAGNLIPDLTEGDFKIFEDGIPQTIRLFLREDVPVTVGLVVDHSGSMGRKIESVLAAARAFIRFSNPSDLMFVVNFNEHVFFGLPKSKSFTNKSALLENAILTTPITGMTALYDAIDAALEHAKTASLDRAILLVVSDGADNASKLTLDELKTKAAQSSTMIYTLGIFAPADPDRNPGPLRELAASAGGEAHFPKDLTQLDPLAERIAREIRNQYTIGYISSQPIVPGARHKIRVVATSQSMGKLNTRARSSYTVGKPK